MKKYLLSLLLVFIFLNGKAHPPWGIVVDSSESIYFADIFHNGMGSLWKLNTNGQITLIAGNFHAHNVSLDDDQNLVSAHGENTYTMITFKGKDRDTLFHTDDFKEFNGGTCTYANGKIYFGIENYIWYINSKGKREKASEHYFEWNQLLYVDESGNIYAPDIGKNNGELVKIDTNGVATVIAQDLISQLNRPRDKHNDILMGIGKDAEANVYICELAGRRIIKIDPFGNKSDFYKAKKYWAPTAIDFHKGCAYILEFKETREGHGGPRVIRINENGKTEILFDFETDYKVHKSSATNEEGKTKKEILLFVLFSAIGLILTLVVTSWFRFRTQKSS